jgi:lambda family phage portal protein
LGYFRNLVKAAFAPGLSASADSAFGRRGASGYDAASHSRRIAGFVGSNESINALLLLAGDELRAKSHKLVRENAWASSAIEEWKAQAIGTGIKPQSKYRDAGGNTEAARGIRRQIQEAWCYFVDEADADGITDFYGQEALAWGSMMESGECFVQMLPRRTDQGCYVPLQFRILEADHVPLTMNSLLPGGNTIRAGIEFDAEGNRVAYWVHPEHPQSGLTFFRPTNQPVRIPSWEADHQRGIIHLFAPHRPGQLRGEPWLTRALVKLYNLDQWDDATLERQKLGAMLLGWITENTPEGVDPLMLSGKSIDPQTGEPASTEDGTAPAGIEFGKLEPGTLLRLMMGENMNFFSPPEVGQNYEQFNESQQRWIAQAVKGLPFENLTGNVSKVNYSSIRARQLAFQRVCQQLQFSIMVYQFCRKVRRSWMDAGVLAGVLDLPGYAANPRPYLRDEWRTPKWTWVDPLKDAEGEVLLVDNLMKPRSQVINELGYDEEEVDEQIQADQDREALLGLQRRSAIKPTGYPTDEPAASAPAAPKGAAA